MAKSELQINRGIDRARRTVSPPDFSINWQDQSTVQLIGLILAVAGALLFLSLRSPEPLPWLVQMGGWTAPVVALSIFVAGGVLVMGDRAGYWSAEALVGGELLLLGLQIGSYTFHNATFSWDLPVDGSHGGLIGSVLGGLLVAGFGQGIANILAIALAMSGGVLLLRYTPLIYPTVYILRVVQWLAAYWVAFTRLPAARRAGYGEQDAPEMTPNFVAPSSPTPDEDDWRAASVQFVDPVTESNTVDAPAVRKVRRAGTKADAKSDTKTTSSRTRKSKSRKRSHLPPMEVLEMDTGQHGSVDVAALQELIEGTLEEFGVPVRVVHVESGPTVTQFGVEPLYVETGGKRRKVRVNKIVNLADDLALALAAPSVRMEAPVPGRPYVGIEVPNATKVMVSMRGILESSAMRKSDGRLLITLGRDTSGAPVIMDLARAPHLLIAGATGSGKSVCINTIIASLLMQHGPESLQFVMVDPKMVELPGYNGVPHLMGKVITEMDQVMGALTWLLLQMDDRYQKFREVGVRNIDAYNELARTRRRGSDSLEPMPYIVLIVDELADLMMTAAEDVERQLCRLAQMARATGIHLILATQRPSTDVVTGLIKANFPSRIAFAVTSQIDSRVILDASGAEQLLGRGDMLLLRPEAAKLARVQGCYVDDGEINAIVDYWRSQDPDMAAPTVPPWNGLMDRMEEKDELLLDAMDVLREMDSCSTSMLQRKMRIGYPKAARLMEQLEGEGVVGPDMGGGQGRKVLLKKEEDDEEDEGWDEDVDI